MTRLVTFMTLTLTLTLTLATPQKQVTAATNCTYVSGEGGKVISADCSHRGWTAVPSGLPSSLVTLDLSGNLLSSLADGNGAGPFTHLRDLETLDLSGNRISRLGNASFSGLLCLQWLSLRGNPLHMTPGTFPADVFKDLDQLTFLDLHLQPFPVSPDLAYPDVALSRLRQLRTLRMNGLGNNVELGPGFSRLEDLEVLDMNGDPGYCTTTALSERFFSSINTSRPLTLNLSDCELGTIHSNTFSFLPTLHSLDLANNRHIKFPRFVEASKSLWKTKIKVLNITGIHRGSNIKIMAEYFQYLGYTRIQHLEVCHVGAYEIELRAMFNLPTDMQYLSVHKNSLIDAVFLYGLYLLPHIQTVDVSVQNHFTAQRRVSSRTEGRNSDRRHSALAIYRTNQEQESPMLLTGERPLTGGSPMRTGESPMHLTGESPMRIGESLVKTGESPVSTGESPMLVTGESPMPLTGGSPMKTGESPMHLTGESPMPLTGESPMPLTGESPMPLTGESPKLMTGESPMHMTGESPMPLAGESPMHLTGESPMKTGESPMLVTGERHLTGESPMKTGESPMHLTGESPMPLTGESPMHLTGESPKLMTGESPMSTGEIPMPLTGESPMHMTGESLLEAKDKSSSKAEVQTEEQQAPKRQLTEHLSYLPTTEHQATKATGVLSGSDKAGVNETRWQGPLRDSLICFDHLFLKREEARVREFIRGLNNFLLENNIKFDKMAQPAHTLRQRERSELKSSTTANGSELRSSAVEDEQTGGHSVATESNKEDMRPFRKESRTTVLGATKSTMDDFSNVQNGEQSTSGNVFNVQNGEQSTSDNVFNVQNGEQSTSGNVFNVQNGEQSTSGNVFNVQNGEQSTSGNVFNVQNGKKAAKSTPPDDVSDVQNKGTAKSTPRNVSGLPDDTFPLPLTVQFVYGSELKLGYTLLRFRFLDNRLERLDLSKNNLPCFLGPWLGLHKLWYFDLSFNFAVYLSKDFFRDMPSLTHLFLQENFLGESFANDSQGLMLSGLKSLQVLNLDSNLIKRLSESAFSANENLTTLSLAHNAITHFKPRLASLGALTFVDLSDNNINFLRQVNMKDFDTISELSNLTIDLYRNPLSCGCDSLDFWYWVVGDSKVRLHRLHQYNCTLSNGSEISYGVLERELGSVWLQCQGERLLTIAMAMLVTLLFVLSVLGVLHYKRWRLRYFYYVGLRRYRRPYRQHQLVNPRPVHDVRDVFISFDDQDPRVRLFLQNVLLPQFDRRGMTYYVSEIDFPNWCIDDIIPEVVLGARKTLALFSSRFFPSSERELEFNMAVYHEEETHQRVIVPVVWERVDWSAFPPEVMVYLEERACIPYQHDSDQFMEMLMTCINTEVRL